MCRMLARLTTLFRIRSMTKYFLILAALLLAWPLAGCKSGPDRSDLNPWDGWIAK